MILCKKVVYSGHVQGVGFRYTAQRIARGLSVAGYVKNLPSGQVELLVEGKAEIVDDLLHRLCEEMIRCIQHAEITNETPRGLTGFEIRF